MNSGLEKIDNFVFDGCESLESITLPSTVTDIGVETFIGCKSLREVVLNEGLRKIEGSSFGCCSSLESITIPSSVVEIGSWAFHGCSSLRVVVLNEVYRRSRKRHFQIAAHWKLSRYPQL